MGNCLVVGKSGRVYQKVETKENLMNYQTQSITIKQYSTTTHCNFQYTNFKECTDVGLKPTTILIFYIKCCYLKQKAKHHKIMPWHQFTSLPLVHVSTSSLPLLRVLRLLRFLYGASILLLFTM